ncbi:MAG TPA: HEAT repeat domain-containing protein, partial [Myxococcota bacterium]|nr:HEAT repeat domain-containing protein [Myxococcota bacterium]
MLSFLGGKKTLTDQLVSANWKDAAERDGLLKQFRESGLRPPDLLPLIAHNDPAVRQIAAELFLARPDERSALLLIEGTADKHPQVRGVALRLFNRHPDDAIRRTLDGLLTDKDHNRQRLGWEYALNLSGNLRLLFLERVLKDGPAGMRATALQKLLQDRDPAVMVAQLLEAARSADPRLNSTAMEALVRVPDPRVLDLMLDRFSNGDAAARDRATAYLRAAAKRDPNGMRKKMLDLLA